MSCILNSGITIDGCFEGLGGIDKIFVSSWTASSYTIDSDDIITGITASNTFYEFEFRNEKGTFDQPGEKAESGAWIYVQTVTAPFNKNDAQKRNTLMLLAKNELLVVVKDIEGSYWLVGKDNGAEVSEFSSGFGTAYTDFNGYTVTIQAREPKLAYKLTDAAFNTLVIA